MRNLALLLVLGAFILTGCNRKPVDDLEEDLLIEVSFSTKPLSVALSKSIATTAESLISKILLFGVDAAGNVVESFPAITTPPFSNIPLTISRQITSLYAIANPSSTLEAATPANVTALIALIDGFATAPASPFLMGGQGLVNSTNIQIELIRAVAKIEIQGKNNFQITSVVVQNTPNAGYGFKREPLAIPVSSRVNYSAVASAAPVLYVAESANSNPATFLVAGTFEGKTASYNITLTVGGTPIDIERNTHYQVGITPVTEDDCIVTITIPDWADMPTDEHVIPDSEFS